MKISVVSTVYNAKEMLRRNLESVLRQDYSCVEHVVVDGASTDGSVEVLKEYEQKYLERGRKLIWVSEKDSGIPEAVNKATSMSTGDLIMFTIDVFANDHVVSEIVEKFETNKIDYLYGGLHYQKDGKIIRRWSGKTGNWRFGFMLATPTLCYTRSVWDKHGPYIEKYKVSHDYDFQIKLFKDKSLKSMSLAKPLVIYYAGGESNGTFKQRWYAIKECYGVLKDNNVPMPAFTNFCKTLTALFAYVFASRKKIELEEWMM